MLKHIVRNHYPKKTIAPQPSMKDFLTKKKIISVEQKEEAARLMIDLCASKFVSFQFVERYAILFFYIINKLSDEMKRLLEFIYQLGGGDKSQVAGLIPSYYIMKKMMKEASGRIENLLRRSVNELIKKNCIYMEIDGKTVGKTTADIEESAAGLLLTLNDDSNSAFLYAFDCFSGKQASTVADHYRFFQIWFKFFILIAEPAWSMI